MRPAHPLLPCQWLGSSTVTASSSIPPPPSASRSQLGHQQNTGEPADDARTRPHACRREVSKVWCHASSRGRTERVPRAPLHLESHSRHGHHVVNEAASCDGGTLHSEETRLPRRRSGERRGARRNDHADDGRWIAASVRHRGFRAISRMPRRGSLQHLQGPLSRRGTRPASCRGRVHREHRSPQICREVHQLRDVLVRVTDPAGGASGWGILNSEIVGAWPELGLGDEHWR